MNKVTIRGGMNTEQNEKTQQMFKKICQDYPV